MITFQQLIQRLTQFWEKRGCVIHQGHDLEVGAGTFNPATFLRSLGPEPYKTAYVEPSRRPSDGRYGENPNRIQLFHQYQVIIKPSPVDIQATYLKSLEAIGFDLKKHDIRFVHDDWESPTLGAWGLGWEVWVDGMEASQFTYFQAVASIPLKPISAEITYGLERLCMFIQGVDHILDIKWNEELTLGDISRQNEIEWSTYNFTEASIEMWKRHFDDYEKEAQLLIARNLPLPAYDFIIKASHAFNLLEARGAISVTERTGYIARVRDLARLAATGYLASREAQNFPLLGKWPAAPQKKLPAVVKVPRSANPKKKSDFLLEIGSEQIPATFVPIGMRNLEHALRKLLTEHELSFDALDVFGTPRRLAVLITGLQEGTAAKKTERRGPAIASAFDAAGKPTPQGQGFLKSLGHEEITLEAIQKGKIKGLEVRTIKESDYLFALIAEKGKSTYALLAEHLPGLILNLDFPKKMRWADLDISYARPLHWIVAIFGKRVIPFTVGEITAARYTFGHAQLDLCKITLKAPQDYLAALRAHKVLANVAERKQSILDQLQALEEEVSGKALEKEKVLAQVLHLVEWPQLAKASFKEQFLKIPQEVLISEMVEHQKYFPISDSHGKLKNIFIITADNTPSSAIVHGNQRVLSARLADGTFLYTEDLKAPLEKFNDRLAVMTFQKELGSMLQKVMRIVHLSKIVNELLEVADPQYVSRAALLCKADLASNLVKEFPELQGIIGKYYALAHNEPKPVAEAIEEHWMPKAEGAALPRTPTGLILSLADKIDNLIAYHSVGLKPTSSSDPFALRRQSLGIIKMLIEGKHSINLQTLLETCTLHFPKLQQDPKLRSAVIEQILHFITQRAKNLFEEAGFKRDEIEASLRGFCLDPYDQFCKIQALHAFRKSRGEFGKLCEVYKRAKGQLNVPVTDPFNHTLASEPAEKALMHALEGVEKKLPDALRDRNYVRAFEEIATLQTPLANLFDQVKILADDLKLRNNRIALLQKVFSHFDTILDFSQIQEV